MADSAATSAAEKKKANLAAFFGKKKAAPAPSEPAAPATPVVPVSSVPAEPVAPATESSSGWVDAPQEPQRVTLGSRFSGRVGDLEEHQEVHNTADIEAEEAKKAFWRARKAPKKKVEEAAPVVTGWKAKLAARKTGAGGAVDVHNEFLFPTLSKATSGFHPNAKFADTGSGDITRHGVASVWAPIALDDDEDEEEPAAAAASAPTVPAAAPGKVAATAAAPPASSSAIASTPAECLPGSGAVLDSDDAVKEACESIAGELRSSLDAEEALRRAGELRCEPVELREHLVGTLLQAGLDAEKVGERNAIRKVLLALVPRRVMTPAMLTRGVASVLELFDDIAVDYPKAAEYFLDMLSGVVEGSVPPGAAMAAGGVAAALAAHKAYVPSWVLPDAVAKKMGVKKAAPPAAASSGAAASAPAPSAAEKASPSEAAAAAAPAQNVAAPAPEPAAPAPTASEAPSAAADAGGDELDDLFATAKKKGKRKGKAAEE